MSVITDLLIVTSLDEREAMEQVNAWCRDHDSRQQQFTQIDTDAAGGNKVFTATVWAMAGNHFPLSDLAEALPTFGWRRPTGVVLTVDYEHDDFNVRVYRADGRSIENEWTSPWGSPSA